jgi:hypothetical protein
MSPWIAERCSEVRPVPLDWLWPRYLARGKLALLDGDPEMGKSLVTLDLIARLSRGGPMPDGAPVERPGTSILLSAEDSAADTVRPRAEAAGVDLTRLILPNFGDRVPRLPEDLPALEALIYEHAAELVVIDPLMAFLPPNVAANLDQCVRQALSPLAALASATGCVILLVRHLAKAIRDRALLRGQGSMGIAAAVRTGLFAAPHPKEEGGRVLAVAKHNLARRPPTLGYRIVESAAGQPVVEWTGEVEVTADGLCKPALAALKAKDRAVDWLKRELAGGPRKTAEVYAAAAEAGIPERTLERAKKELEVHSHRHYDYKENCGEWYWYDGDAPWPADAPFRKPRQWTPLPPIGE